MRCNLIKAYFLPHLVEWLLHVTLLSVCLSVQSATGEASSLTCLGNYCLNCEVCKQLAMHVLAVGRQTGVCLFVCAVGHGHKEGLCRH